ncbi:RNA polymerase sigma factor [Paenibacillus mesophilus]|uniref:RNA polymerase sigma factor n=1 Tax=Paenibacillus mesophilus TaxID=2582849 RepID=UPI00110E0FCB|nr:RNA polymerase sigma factor [Paenibacillus mesophilus]TMV49024.1 RNA polymerase sigma factor [Paenibacillus mesophilus]
MNKTDLQLIGDNTVDPWGRFIEIISPFRSQLWHYCRKLTGSPWDAEDLLQDTLLKSFASLSALSHRQQPLQTKSFLFRVATNHWIDQCRRMKVKLEEYAEEHLYESEAADSIEVSEALEVLVHHLTPKQAAVFILMESFSFTAKETAELISATETAVNAMLHRARANLRKLNKDSAEEGAAKNRMAQQDAVNPEFMKKFLEAFNRKDYKGLARFLIDEATFSFVSMNSSEYGKSTITQKSLNPYSGTKLAKDLFVYADTLWGQPAVIILLRTEQGLMLNNINTLEWEMDKVVRWKDYSFCRDFMRAAASELGLPLSDFI